MGAQIIDGKAISHQIKEQLAGEVADFVAAGNATPGLTVVLVGDDPASAVYVRNKIKSCEQVGITSTEHRLPASTSQADLLALVRKLNAAPEVNGILVQLPLPKQIDDKAIIEAIAPEKDVDGFHPYNIGSLTAQTPVLRPCTPYGCIKLLQASGIDIAGKHAVIIGRSNIVGRPVALELLLEGATVTVCHSQTQDLPGHVRQADIVVAGVGRANFVQGDWVKLGAVVIDVGVNRLESGKLCGDVDFAAASANASWITPVPGGVGPMTVAMLMHNTLSAAKAQSQHKG